MPLLSKIENSIRASISKERPSEGVLGFYNNRFMAIASLVGVVVYVFYSRGKDDWNGGALVGLFCMLAGVKLWNIKRQYPALFATAQELVGISCAFVNLAYTPIFARPVARALILVACGLAVMKSQESFDTIYEKEHQRNSHNRS